MSIFPIVVQYLGDHGLEPGAKEGRDYIKYEVIRRPNDLPINFPFEIIATKVKIPN